MEVENQGVLQTEYEAMSHDLLKPYGWGAVKARGQWRVWEHEMEKTQHCKLWLSSLKASLLSGDFGCRPALRQVQRQRLQSESVLHAEMIRSSFDKRFVWHQQRGCEVCRKKSSEWTIFKSQISFSVLDCFLQTYLVMEQFSDPLLK